jgi:hypothetical protein
MSCLVVVVELRHRLRWCTDVVVHVVVVVVDDDDGDADDDADDDDAVSQKCPVRCCVDVVDDVVVVAFPQMPAVPCSVLANELLNKS